MISETRCNGGAWLSCSLCIFLLNLTCLLYFSTANTSIKKERQRKLSPAGLNATPGSPSTNNAQEDTPNDNNGGTPASSATGMIRRATRIDRLASGYRGRSRRHRQTVHQINRPSSSSKLNLPKGSPCTSPGSKRAESLRSSQISIDEQSV